MAHRPYPWKRYLLANWRDVRVLLRQFYMPLLFFVSSVLPGDKICVFASLGVLNRLGRLNRGGD